MIFFKTPFVRTWVKIHIFEEKFQKANVCFYGRRVAIKSESLLESSALRPPWFFCRRPCSSPAARTPWLPSPAPQSAQASWDWYPSNYVQAVFYLVAMMRKLKEFYLCTSTLARDCCVIALNYKLYKAEQPFWNEWVLPNSCAPPANDSTDHIRGNEKSQRKVDRSAATSSWTRSLWMVILIKKSELLVVLWNMRTNAATVQQGWWR